MTIDDTIYVNRPDLLRLADRFVDFADFTEALHDAVSGATGILVLGGYYNIDALVDLCRQIF